MFQTAFQHLEKATTISDMMTLWHSAPQWHDWRWQLKNSFNHPDGLIGISGISQGQLQGIEQVLRRYKMSVTPYYLSLIDWSDPFDPIRLQCLPDLREIECNMMDSSEDPLNEESHMPIDGLIHKFRDRALVLVTNVCAVYCRHCNRKRYWSKGEKADSSPLFKRLEAVADYITRHQEIREVILSGGDPLMLSDDMLQKTLGYFKDIPHIEVVRLGSRVPVTLPMRITDSLCRLLASFRPLWFNTQFNHPRELTEEAKNACDRLQRAGIPVSSQTVLLKGVNDNVSTMTSLLQGLQKIMVRPYYLFQCEPVKGVEHFRTEPNVGVAIMDKIWGATGGLCIPHLVIDLPEGKKRLV